MNSKKNNRINEFEEDIINEFKEDITELCKNHSVLKMSEELFRFTLYKNYINLC